MTYKEIQKELKIIFKNLFEKPDSETKEELAQMTLPRGLKNLYLEVNPSKEVTIGKFIFLPAKQLIDANIWDSPGSELYEMGFTVVGLDPDGNFYCLSIKEKNKAELNDVLLASSRKKYSIDDCKKVRTEMKFLGNSLESLLTKEIGFYKKAQKKKQ